MNHVINQYRSKTHGEESQHEITKVRSVMDCIKINRQLAALEIGNNPTDYRIAYYAGRAMAFLELLEDEPGEEYSARKSTIDALNENFRTLIDYKATPYSDLSSEQQILRKNTLILLFLLGYRRLRFGKVFFDHDITLMMMVQALAIPVLTMMAVDGWMFCMVSSCWNYFKMATDVFTEGFTVGYSDPGFGKFGWLHEMKPLRMVHHYAGGTVSQPITPMEDISHPSMFKDKVANDVVTERDIGWLILWLDDITDRVYKESSVDFRRCVSTEEWLDRCADRVRIIREHYEQDFTPVAMAATIDQHTVCPKVHPDSHAKQFDTMMELGLLNLPGVPANYSASSVGSDPELQHVDNLILYDCTLTPEELVSLTLRAKGGDPTHKGKRYQTDNEGNLICAEFFHHEGFEALDLDNLYVEVDMKHDQADKGNLVVNKNGVDYILYGKRSLVVRDITENFDIEVCNESERIAKMHEWREFYYILPYPEKRYEESYPELWFQPKRNT